MTTKLGSVTGRARQSAALPRMKVSPPLSVGDLADGRAPIDAQSADLVSTWLRGFLQSPAPALGRPGAVCPYVKQAIDADVVTIMIVDAGSSPADDIERLVLANRDSLVTSWFANGTSYVDRSLSCRLIIFDGLTASAAATLVDGVQARLKPVFVQQGLMLGQFHSTQDEPGLWNRDFRPLRSPVPMLAIRPMVPTDLPFLTEDYAFKSYLRHHGQSVPRRLRPLAEELATIHGSS